MLGIFFSNIYKYKGNFWKDCKGSPYAKDSTYSFAFQALLYKIQMPWFKCIYATTSFGQIKCPYTSNLSTITEVMTLVGTCRGK